MKIVCLEEDNCGESYYLKDLDYKTIHLDQKFHKCKYCNSLAVLVKNNFVFNENKNLFIKMYWKTFKGP